MTIFTTALSLDGLGVTFDGDVDGSVTPQYMEYRPPAGMIAVLRGMSVTLAGNSISVDAYAANVELANGCLLQRVIGSGAGATVDDTIHHVPLRTNREWTELCGARNVEIHEYGGGANYIFGTLDFLERGAPYPILPGQALRVAIQDNLGGLAQHRFQAFGMLKPA